MITASVLAEDWTTGRYRILERVAAGGMGEVYRAKMVTAGSVEKSVALKLVRSEYAQNPSFVEMFVNEARVAMSMSHANVVQSFDVGRIDDRWFITMEYVEGVTLGQLSRVCRDRLGQPVPIRHVMTAAVEALKGLDYAHRLRADDGRHLQIVHCDVSPGNILVSYEGEVKVADFGVAKSQLAAEDDSLTIRGKIAYMPPEQLLAAPLDARADLYAMGVVLYELLAGRRPYRAASPGELMTEVLRGDPPPLSDVPDELSAIVRRAMAPERDDRFPNAATMRQALEQVAMASGYLLSSPDLADFVEETVPRRGPSDSVGEATTVAATPERDGGVPRPFELRLGQEIERVRTTEPVSVFVTRSATVDERPLEPPTSGVRPAARSDAEVLKATPRPSRRVAALTIVGIGVLAAAAGLLALGSSHRPLDPVAPSEDMPLESAGTPTSLAPENAPVESADTPTSAATEAEAAERSHTLARDEERVESDDPPTRAPREEVAARVTTRRDRRARTKGAVAPDPIVPAQTMAEATATLQIGCTPWGYVSIDGQRVGQCNRGAHEVAPGRHHVEAVNPPAGLSGSETVTIGAGETRNVFVRWAR